VSQPLGGAGRTAVYIRLSLFYTTFLGMGGVTVPFWPTWLQSKGLDAGAIGVMLSVPMLVRIASPPLLARLADRRGAAKPILLAALTAALLFYVLFAVSNGFWALLAVTFFANGLYGSILPLGESISLSSCRDHRLDYGRIRLWGSISFILGAVAAGQFLAGRSPAWILWLTLIGFALSIAAALVLPGRRAAPPPSGAGMRSLMANGRFRLFMVASGLIQASHALLNGFGTIRWLAAGYDKATIGWLWGEGVVVEITLFAMGAAVLRRLGPLRLLTLGGSCAVIRWVGIGWRDDLASLAVLQALHGFTYGATHLAAMAYILQTTPPHLAATAQGLHAAIAWGVIFALATLASGPLYARLGGHAFFVMAGLAFAGTVAAAILARRQLPAEEAS
jgi:PPP family 3-phenylpropionic acid transporter